jgi:Predicted pPIWI-associating nuclease
MTDALTALDQMSEDVAGLAAAVTRVRTKTVRSVVVQPTASAIARTYFESVRLELSAVQNRAGLIEEIDFVLQTLLQLGTAPREKEAYLGHIAELQPYLLEATVDIMKARGNRRLILSQTERAILDTLGKMLPLTAASYEQALLDLAQGKRVSWRGTAAELREVLREAIDHLAPDDKVLASPGFQPEQGQTLPTQKQKVRFILRARKGNSASVAVAEASLSTVDESIAVLARSTYRRGSASTHAATDPSEIRNLKRYVDALLAELLEIS